MPADEPTDFLQLVQFFAAELVACSKKTLTEADDPDLDPESPQDVYRLCRDTLKDFDLKSEVLKRCRTLLNK